MDARVSIFDVCVGEGGAGVPKKHTSIKKALMKPVSVKTTNGRLQIRSPCFSYSVTDPSSFSCLCRSALRQWVKIVELLYIRMKLCQVTHCGRTMNDNCNASISLWACFHIGFVVERTDGLNLDFLVWRYKRKSRASCLEW